MAQVELDVQAEKGKLGVTLHENGDVEYNLGSTGQITIEHPPPEDKETQTHDLPKGAKVIRRANGDIDIFF